MMEFYSENPATPYQGNKVKGLGPLRTVTFNENVKTPFPQKTFANKDNNATTPFMSKLGTVKSSVKPRRALADISNNVQGGGGFAAAPKTGAKTALAVKSSVKKTVVFDEEIETCGRISKYRYTPHRPDLDRAIKITTNQWMDDSALVEEFRRHDAERDFDIEMPLEPAEVFVDDSAFEIEQGLLL